jgi:hypothetical protein
VPKPVDEHPGVGQGDRSLLGELAAVPDPLNEVDDLTNQRRLSGRRS